MYAIQDTEDFETVLSLSFPKQDVLVTETDRQKRKANLIKAVTLESLAPTEVVLYLETKAGCQKVKSRVLATGDQQVLIERGFAVPISSIHRVDFP